MMEKVIKMEEAIMYTDGGARNNPGIAGIGIIIENKDGNVIKEISQYIGEQTNNVAEYKALSRGLEIALDLGIKKIVCYSDSELVVKQVKGEYKVKNERMIYVAAFISYYLLYLHTNKICCFIT